MNRAIPFPAAKIPLAFPEDDTERAMRDVLLAAEDFRRGLHDSQSPARTQQLLERIRVCVGWFTELENQALKD